MEDETKFHWAEGMKYVLEGIKALFILNGAATVSILTFIGNTQTKSELLVYAMASFAIGAATCPIAFGVAYFTQLSYGSSARTGDNWASAQKIHSWAYVPVVCGLLLFFIGTALAIFGLLESNTTLPK